MAFDLEGCIVKESGSQLENNFTYDEDTPVTYQFSNNLSEKLIKINPLSKELIDNLFDFFS